MLRTSNLPLRWSWLAALLGGMLHALGDLLNLTHLGAPFAESIGSSLFSVQQTVYLLSAALLLLGLIGLYAIQSETTGRLGMWGFLLAFLGTVLFAGAIWALLFIGPLVAAEAPQLLQGQPPASAAYRLTRCRRVPGVVWDICAWLAVVWRGHAAYPLPSPPGCRLPHHRGGPYLPCSTFPASHGRHPRRGHSMAGSGSLEEQGRNNSADLAC